VVVEDPFTLLVFVAQVMAFPGVTDTFGTPALGVTVADAVLVQPLLGSVTVRV
jgi:hypothetical protein